MEVVWILPCFSARSKLKDALTLMIGFGALLIALLTLVVAIVVAINQKK